MTPPNALLSPLLFHVHYGVEPDILEDESVKGMFSARLSSRNCSPNSVLSKDLLVYINGLLLGRIDRGLPPLPLFEEAGILPLWRQRFPNARQKV